MVEVLFRLVCIEQDGMGVRNKVPRKILNGQLVSTPAMMKWLHQIFHTWVGLSCGSAD